MLLFELLKTNYGTYVTASNGAKERHFKRLSVSLLVAVILAVFSKDSSAAYPIMVTSITILTGFTFSALFSDHVLADVGLPKPADETDRQDMLRLTLLSENFKARSSYFILLSIVDAILLIVASLKFSMPGYFSGSWQYFVKLLSESVWSRIPDALHFLAAVSPLVFFVIATMIFIECLYTFYRLSETIIAIVGTRSKYLKVAGKRL